MFVLGSCRSAMVPVWPSMAAVVGRTCIRPTSPTVPTAFGLYALSTCATASATSGGRPRCWASCLMSRTCVSRPTGCGFGRPTRLSRGGGSGKTGNSGCGSARTKMGAIKHAMSARYRHAFGNELRCTEAPYQHFGVLRLTLTDCLQPAGTGWAQARFRQEQAAPPPQLSPKNGCAVQPHVMSFDPLAPAAPPSTSWHSPRPGAQVDEQLTH